MNFGHKSGLGFATASFPGFEGAGWRDFLGRPAIADAAPGWKDFHASKTILVAGAGGSIGSHLARRLMAAHPRALILLDRGEHNLYRIHGELSMAGGGTAAIAALADIGDEPALDELFAKYRPDLVYHAAAFKQVPILESNPLAALRNNALGTWILARTAARHEVPVLVSLSTDKAASPRSILGASKRIAELALLGLGGSRTRMNSLRLGNVLGSRGSVVPLFLRQIARGGPVTVTHPEVRRYFLTLDESAELLLAAATCPEGGQLLVPELGEAIPVLRLAEYLIRRAGPVPGKDIAITLTGLRPGDKLAEDLISSRERRGEPVNRWLYRVATPAPAADEMDEALSELRACIERRDGAAALEIVCRLVPEFQPGAELRQSLAAPGAEVRA